MDRGTLYTRLSFITIPEDFLNHPPAQYKVDCCAEYFRTHGRLDKEIIINEDLVLMDGYKRYLALQQCGVDFAEMKVVDTKHTYVFGIHPGNNTVYCWKTYKGTIDIDKLRIGGYADVHSKGTIQTVFVVDIQRLSEPPIDQRIKTVVKCY